MERCARKNTLMAKILNTGDKESSAQNNPWHVRRELIKRAILLSLLYGLVQFFGFRELATALLKGAASSPVERVGCMVYLFFYGSFIFLVPTLIIAALLLTIWEMFGRRIIGMLNRHNEQK